MFPFQIIIGIIFMILYQHKICLFDIAPHQAKPAYGYEQEEKLQQFP